MNYHSVFVGPAIQIKKTKVSYEKKISSCLNGYCKNYYRQISTKFCPHCGGKVEEKIDRKIRDLNANDIRHKMVEDSVTTNEYFFTSGYDDDEDYIYLFSNYLKYEGEKVPGFHIEKEYGLLKEINQNLIDQELSTFCRLFDKQIEYFKKHYDVKITWGVFGRIS